MKKRLLSILLTACLLMGLLPTVALAAEDGVKYLDENGAEQIYTGSYTEITSSTYWKWTTGWYVVNSNVTFSEIPNVEGDVHLILADNCSLSLGYIYVDSGNSLTIYAQSTDEDTMGKLVAQHDASESVGIGGHEHGGTITINGGKINASGMYGAGIGGGGGSFAGNGGIVTINGGIVTATSTFGAGIGGGGRPGSSGDGGVITINGGTVIATSTYGAGIGGGNHGDGTGGDGGKITINGGTVIATSTYGAGIGGGNGRYCGGNGGTVTINGGDVTASSGTTDVVSRSAGIGGGSSEQAHVGSGADVTITGGTVTASTTNPYIAAIGWGDGDTGPYGTPGTLIITGGDITPPAKYYEYYDIAGIKPDGDGKLVAFGNLTLPVDLTIPEGKTLTIPSGASLTIPEGKTLTVNSTITVQGTLTNNGTIIGSGSITPDEKKLNYKAAPSTPVIDSVSADSITLQPVIGETAVEYSKDNTNWQSGTTFSGLTAATSYTFYARYQANGFYQGTATISSGATAYTAYAAPSVGDGYSINFDTETITVDTGYEVNKDSGFDNSTAVTTGSAVTPGQTLYVRKSASGDVSASEGTEFTIPARPVCNLAINNTTESVTVLNGYRYNTTGADYSGTWTEGDGSNVKVEPGSSIYIYKAATTGAFKSDVQTLTAPSRSATPTPAGVDETVDGKNDGQITGVDNTMEYRQGTTGSWTACAGTAVTGLAPGTYQVRVKATSTSFASAAADVTIATGAAKTYTLSITSTHTFAGAAYGYTQPAAQAITITSSGNWESAITSVTVDSTDFTIGGSGSTVAAGDSISTWTVQPTAGLAAGSYTATITVTYNDGATATAPVSFTVTKAAQDAPSAPTVKSKTYNSVTLNDIEDSTQSGAKAQYSIDGGTTWQDSPEFTGLSASTEYSFVTQYRETDNYFASPVSTELSVTTNAAPSSGGSTYAITVESAKNGTVTVAPKTAVKGATVTITVEPDKGYTLETLTVTDKNGNEIELTNKGDGKYTFTMPASKVTVTATFMENNSMLNFFVDVFPGDYYYDAVLWAAENGITSGVDDTHFAPTAPCTRAQMVTFLWRAAGCPAPKSSEMPFTDVVKGSYYETAVLWAVENGITYGTSATTFAPDAICDRAQFATFLWRSQGKPGAGTSNPFTDVAEGTYYTDAVLWAAENGITEGTSSTTFSPYDNCTRAQTVTFLYRCLGK